MDITSVKGVSSTKAEKLEDIGVKFAEDLSQANAARVDQISGCSPQLVANAQRFMSEEVGTNLNAVNYKCGKCGAMFGLDRDPLEKHERFSKCENKQSMGGYF